MFEYSVEVLRDVLLNLEESLRGAESHVPRGRFFKLVDTESSLGQLDMSVEVDLYTLVFLGLLGYVVDHCMHLLCVDVFDKFFVFEGRHDLALLHVAHDEF